jgi:hypothetical protein
MMYPAPQSKAAVTALVPPKVSPTKVMKPTGAAVQRRGALTEDYFARDRPDPGTTGTWGNLTRVSRPA